MTNMADSGLEGIAEAAGEEVPEAGEQKWAVSMSIVDERKILSGFQSRRRKRKMQRAGGTDADGGAHKAWRSIGEGVGPPAATPSLFFIIFVALFAVFLKFSSVFKSDWVGAKDNFKFSVVFFRRPEGMERREEGEREEKRKGKEASKYFSFSFLMRSPLFLHPSQFMFLSVVISRSSSHLHLCLVPTSDPFSPHPFVGAFAAERVSFHRKARFPLASQPWDTS